MGKVLSALSVSVDGFITGRDPGPGNGLGDGGQLFNWYFDGDTPSKLSSSFRLSETSAEVFDRFAVLASAPRSPAATRTTTPTASATTELRTRPHL